MNFRDEIPQRAFIDAQIIGAAQASGHLEPSIAVVSGKYCLEDYRVLGPAHAAGLLYCLLVVPRELWWSEEILARVEAHAPQSYFSFNEPPGSTEELFRRLRNAVAHADFTVSSEGTFTFEDGGIRGSSPRFSATIELPQLQRFLCVVGAELANSRSVG